MRTGRILLGIGIACCAVAPAFWMDEAPRRGGTLTVAQRAEPKTLNPVLALDAPSREVIGRMQADLITIDRISQATTPSLAESWNSSPDGLHYTVQLRRDLRFSDGQPFDADDVVFTFRVYLDEKLRAPQRDLLVINNAPIVCRKTGPLTVAFDFPAPYAAAERIFDSVAILPRHLLEKNYQEGTLGQSWALNTDPSRIAGLGPFRLKEYRPGERLVLERNPYYWKKPLPYLDQIQFVFAGDQNAQLARLMSGDADLVNRVGARAVAALRSHGLVVHDAGPSLEYNFLVFNLDPDGDATPGKSWFQQLAFRQAVSAAIDRQGIVRLVYQGLGVPLWGHVTPGNRRWMASSLPHPERSTERARQLLAGAGFRWGSEGRLLDASGRRVEFTILVASSNEERIQMATIIQDDLKQLGMAVQVAPLEFRSLADRVLTTHRFDAAVMGLGGGDADPNAEMNVWLSGGAMHLWHPSQRQPGTAWEAEIDRLMREQAAELNGDRRKRLYDRVQAIEQEQLPIICLASPHVLVAARDRVRNLRPSALDHYSLWNAEQIYLSSAKGQRPDGSR